MTGLPNLSKIVLQAADRIAVIAAAGVNADNADIILSGTGAHGVHAGSSVMSVVSHDIDFTAGGVSTATMGIADSSNDDMKWEEVHVAKAERYVESAKKGFTIYQRNKVSLPPPLHTGGADDDAEVYPTYF